MWEAGFRRVCPDNTILSFVREGRIIAFYDSSSIVARGTQWTKICSHNICGRMLFTERVFSSAGLPWPRHECGVIQKSRLLSCTKYSCLHSRLHDADVATKAQSHKKGKNQVAQFLVYPLQVCLPDELGRSSDLTMDTWQWNASTWTWLEWRKSGFYAEKREESPYFIFQPRLELLLFEAYLER